MLEPSGLYYPNRFARAFLLSTEDVMGSNGLNTILSMAELPMYVDNMPPADMAKQFDFAYLAALSQALEEMYGPRGGRGIALKIGRATFSLGVKNFGVMAGMADPAFRALPLQKRLRLGLKALAAVFNEFSDQQNSIEEDADSYRFLVEVSPFSWGRLTDKPVCHAFAGIIQESLRWSSNGHEFHVFEVACRANNSENDVFKIHKNPIGGVKLG